MTLIQPIKDRGGYRQFAWRQTVYKLRHDVNKLEFKDLLDKNNCILKDVWNVLPVNQKPCFNPIQILPYHCGHDYNADADDAVKAIGDGKVIFSDEVNGFGSYGGKGGVIIIQHKYNDIHFLGLYGHVQRLKSVGKNAYKGDIIGKLIVYKTTQFRADHLHFCIIAGDVIPSGNWGYRDDITGFFDPVQFIKERS